MRIDDVKSGCVYILTIYVPTYVYLYCRLHPWSARYTDYR